MTPQTFAWILPLSVITITGFSCALISYVWFFRHVQIKVNLIGSAFLIPLVVTVYGFIFEKNLPMTQVIALSEIAMVLLLIVHVALLKYRASLEASLFISLLTSGALCIALSSLNLSPMMHQELRIYLMAGFALTSALVILTRNTPEAPLTGGFVFLGIAQLLALFESIPLVAAASLAFKAYFYFHMTRLLFSMIHQEIMKEVKDARRIRKDFNDELRKEVKKQVFYMERNQEKMAKISQTDSLTDVLNRKGIMDQIERLVDDRSHNQFSIFIFDIDKFKNINDLMGHPVGDKCLKTLSQIARANLRPGDSLGRYGGDEFMILLPGTDTDTAFQIAERFRQQIQETEDPHFTISIGIATYPQDGRNNRELLEHADAGLYIAKETGRNRVSRRPGA